MAERLFLENQPSVRQQIWKPAKYQDFRGFIYGEFAITPVSAQSVDDDGVISSRTYRYPSPSFQH
jgi:hypothetical protein